MELIKFQSTHPYRVRHCTCRKHQSSTMFQSTHPYRVRHAYGDIIDEINFVSIHAPIQGATSSNILISLFSTFQSTHPYRVRLRYSLLFLSSIMFQSTHPYRVRRYLDIFYLLPFSVSIHAPIQGATRLQLKELAADAGFNPRTHTGCDRKILDKRVRPNVSIHAPIQGATLYQHCLLAHTSSFNPRTHTGCDPHCVT